MCTCAGCGESDTRPRVAPLRADPVSSEATLSGVGQREVATVLFWQYCLAGVTMSLWATVGLALFLPDGGGAGAEEIELGSGDL